MHIRNAVAHHESRMEEIDAVQEAVFVCMQHLRSRHPRMSHGAALWVRHNALPDHYDGDATIRAHGEGGVPP